MFWFGIGLLVLVLVLIVAITSRPDSFRIARSATVNAPPDVVFGYVNDFHKWSLWSPFEKLDPNLERTFGGAPAGVGATYGWSGNAKAGEGTMVIQESTPHKRIAIDLRFTRPFKATNVSEFVFEPTPGGVTVTWATSGKNSMMGKAFSMVVNMDKMLGKDFDEGLRNLKAVAEGEVKPAQPA